MKTKKWILPLIVISQFCCTSLWFAGNGVMTDLVKTFHLTDDATGHLTSVVQLGFIVGSLLFALLTIADRFSPSKVFFVSAIIASVFNLATIYEENTFSSLLTFRFFTGFFLAGIYPVGMKIAADYFKEGLGKSLGFLVGALVLGTAFPHFLRGINDGLPWRIVLIFTSCLATLGGIMMILFVPNGPYCKPSQKIYLSSVFNIFKNKPFRTAAFGYFGHMWELYTFWAFVPILIGTYTSLYPASDLNIPILSFFIIAIGGVACVMSGYLSLTYGTRKIAFLALLASCICCLTSPLFFYLGSEILFIGFLLFWGMVVIADSPLFSTLVAHNASPDTKGTALTIVNSIGFMITIVSIQLINLISSYVDNRYLYIFLAIGPFLGIITLYKNRQVI